MKNPLQTFLRKVLLLFILSIFVCLRALPQNSHLIDSLKNVAAISKDDTNKVMLLYRIAGLYRISLPDTAMNYYHKALGIAEDIDAKEFIAQCLIAIGVNLNIKGLPGEATENLERALKISEETGDKEKISTCYLNIGIINHDLGSYDKAIEYYFKSLKIAQEIGFKRGVSWSYNNLGIAYFDQGSYDKSIESYLQALKIYEELRDKRNMSACLTNIGIVHSEQLSYDKAIEYYQKSLSLNEEVGDKRGMAICYINIGNIFNKQTSYDKANEYYNKALKLFEETGDKRGIADSYQNIGDLYVSRGYFDKANEYYLKILKLYKELEDKMGMAKAELGIANLNISRTDSVPVSGEEKLKYLNQAIIYGNESIENAREMKLLPLIKEAANKLMTAYNKLGNYKKALEFAGILIATQDSLFTEEKTKAIQEMSARYETEKKQQQIELQESQLIAKDARIQQQKILRNALIGGLAAIAMIIVVIAMAYRQKKKDNKKIMEKNEQILEANEELKQLIETTSRQNDEIISSIVYAQKIQSAILPPEAYINELLNENFIFYKPKEIVSGDFYWIKQVMNYIILGSADCTGHGVPGAFMSILGISYLNEIVQSREVTQPNQILNELRKDIKQSLRQSGKKEESRDGIDIALCVIDKKKNILQFSGAHNPLYLIRDNNGESELEEIKADPMPVGVHFLADKSFTNHEVKLEIGDTFYIFSDGYADQNGGQNNYSYTREKFKKLLLDIHDRPMYEQKEILEQTLKDWMGDRSQRDDILVIGVRV
jgi:serine phosphatase RsbU (regulator of sigma subunit)/tetratricopeptide (TPR) repeat protein